jgi:mannose-6-phosphate isomerase
MNKLYPLKFKPIIKDKIWGGTKLKTRLHKTVKTDRAGESWEISGFPGNISIVKNGFLAGNNLEELIEIYMGDLIGDGVFEKFGTLFPLLIKFIDANDALSIQVHPDDNLAERMFGSYGKTEMWYIIDAEKDADIIIGFNQGVTKETLKKHLENKTLLPLLNKEKAEPGDVFFVPSGRIHAINRGILLAEIQQTSDATLRVYDYDRPDEKGKLRELHTEKALEAIDYKLYPSYKTQYGKIPDKPNNLITCDYFTTNCILLSNEITRDYQELDSFVVYICIDGSFQILYDDKELEPVRRGETILLPAELKNVKLIPETNCKILETYIEGLTSENKTADLLENLF